MFLETFINKIAKRKLQMNVILNNIEWQNSSEDVKRLDFPPLETLSFGEFNLLKEKWGEMWTTEVRSITEISVVVSILTVSSITFANLPSSLSSRSQYISSFSRDI